MNLDTLKSKAKTAIAPRNPNAKLMANEIALKISAAEAELKVLEGQRDDASIDALISPEGEQKLHTFNVKVSELQDQLAMLRAARRGVIEREKQESINARRAIQKSQFAAMSKHLEFRDKAAAKLAEAIKVATDLYKEMQAENAAARKATPAGLNWPLLSGAGENLHGLTAREMYRWATPLNELSALPGAMYGDVNFQHRPKDQPELVKLLQHETAFIKTKLKAQIPD